MRFKRVFATMLAIATVATIGSHVTPASAAGESDSFDGPEFILEDGVSDNGCVVSGFAVCEGLACSTAATGSLVTLTGPEVPLVSDSRVALDQQLAAEEEQREAEKNAEQQKKARRKYKRALRLLAAIVYCEAGGQCYAGRLAVAAVVMNRVKAGGYPNTIKGVLWQPYQFGPIRQGKMARELRYYDQGLYKQPERSGSLKAAKDILAGKYTVVYNGRKINLRKYHNFNGHLSNAKIRISGHDFA